MMSISNEIVLAFIVIVNLWALRAQRCRTERLQRKLGCLLYSHGENLNEIISRKFKKIENKFEGKSAATLLKAKSAEMLGQRAFNLASSANLAVMALQRTLQVRPAYLPKRNQVANEVGQDKVMEAVGGTADYSGFDWLYPVLDEEERDLIDKAREFHDKHQEQGDEGTKV